MLQVLVDGLSMKLSGSQDIMCVARRSFLTSVQERTWNSKVVYHNLLVQKLGRCKTSTLDWTLDWTLRSIIDRQYSFNTRVLALVLTEGHTSQEEK